MNPDQALINEAPASPKRRRLLIAAAGLSAAGVATVGMGVLTRRNHPLAMSDFFDLSRAMRTLERLHVSPQHTRSGWSLPEVLHHAAQSIDYSLDGYPQLKPAWFSATLGSAAFAIFSARGKMSHGLAEPIPGAPPLAPGETLSLAADRAMAALLRFDRHTGAFAPHFAYGVLSKSDYARAHLMHLANHWDLVDPG